MSKLTDKLQRLGAVPRDEAEDDSEERRVFRADEVDEFSASPQAPAAAGETPTPREGSTSAASSSLRRQLERNHSLERRQDESRARRESTTRSAGADAAKPSRSRPSSGTRSRGGSGNGVGERLEDLRIQAKALIDAGRTESALPLLHEMVSLQPRHPFPLEALADYYREIGEEEFARLYEARLGDVSPF